MRVKYTPSARAELIKELGFIASRNFQAAQNISAKIKKGFKQLASFPDSGRVVPELGDLGKRELLVKPLRLFYQIEDGTIWIVAVYHEKQLVSGED